MKVKQIRFYNVVHYNVDKINLIPDKNIDPSGKVF